MWYLFKVYELYRSTSFVGQSLNVYSTSLKFSEMFLCRSFYYCLQPVNLVRLNKSQFCSTSTCWRKKKKDVSVFQDFPHQDPNMNPLIHKRLRKEKHDKSFKVKENSKLLKVSLIGWEDKAFCLNMRTIWYEYFMNRFFKDPV